MWSCKRIHLKGFSAIHSPCWLYSGVGPFRIFYSVRHASRLSIGFKEGAFLSVLLISLVIVFSLVLIFFFFFFYQFWMHHSWQIAPSSQHTSRILSSTRAQYRHAYGWWNACNNFMPCVVSAWRRISAPGYTLPLWVVNKKIPSSKNNLISKNIRMWKNVDMLQSWKCSYCRSNSAEENEKKWEAVIAPFRCLKRITTHGKIIMHG